MSGVLTWIQDQGRAFNSWLGSVLGQPKPTLQDAVKNTFNPNAGHENTQVIAQAMMIGRGIPAAVVSTVPAVTTIAAQTVGTSDPRVKEDPHVSPPPQPEPTPTSPGPNPQTQDSMQSMMTMMMTMMMVKMMIGLIPSSDGRKRRHNDDEFED